MYLYPPTKEMGRDKDIHLVHEDGEGPVGVIWGVEPTVFRIALLREGFAQVWIIEGDEVARIVCRLRGATNGR